MCARAQNIKKQRKNMAGDYMTEVRCRNGLCKFHTGDDHCSLDKILLGWKGQLQELHKVSQEDEKALVCANYERKERI